MALPTVSWWEAEEMKNDSIGPSIYCSLNSPSFPDGGNVNATPYFVAQIMDKDGAVSYTHLDVYKRQP